MKSPSNRVETPWRTGRASEGAHWYTRSGEAVHEVQGKNGQWRPTTLREARPNLWVPSVTGIQQIPAKPALTKWIGEQIFLATVTSPLIDGYRAGEVAEKDFCEHVFAETDAQRDKAAQLGTHVHTQIGCHLCGEPTEAPWDLTALAIEYELEKIAPRESWISEKSFCSTRWGIGGTIDWRADVDERRYIVDFKGKEWEPGHAPSWTDLAWPEMAQQLAAYDCGLDNSDRPTATCANIWFNRKQPGEIVVGQPYDLTLLDKEWRKFKCLLQYWQIDKNYFPGSLV